MLLTKLYKPQITVEHVFREHLIEDLHKNQHKPCTLVSAPAGYGKSMLISSWMDRCKYPFAWISLSKGDNDFRLFLSYINVAIRKAFPGSLSKFDMLLNASEMPPFKVVEETLINELDEINKEFILILDDYHHIQSEEINNLLSFLITFPPQHMHLVIITRRDPSLNLSRLRSHSRLNEIRMTELGFSEPETAKLFNNLLVKELNPGTIKSLRETTEGWITGLRLASFLVNKDEDADLILGKLEGNFHLFTEYMISEVLQRQPKEYQKLLLVTSLLDRFNVDLVDEICQFENANQDIRLSGKDFIQWLVKSNLFIISLDNKNEWFRYHHLFQELLQAQLKDRKKAKEIEYYHKQAAGWYEKKDLLEEALKHELSAKNIPAAIEIIIKNRYELMNTGQWNRLEKLVRMFPFSIVDNNPLLLSTCAYNFEYRGEMADIVDNRDKAKGLLVSLPDKSKMRNILTGELKVLDSELQLLEGNSFCSLKNAEEALKLLPENAYHIWSYAVGEIVLSHQMMNKIDHGFDIIKDLKVKQKLPNDLTKARMELWYCMAYKMEGDMHRLKRPSLECIRLGEENEIQDSIAFGRYFLGTAHYMLNELEEAEPYLKAIVKDPYAVRPNYLIQGTFLLALIYIKQGYDIKASDIINSVISQATETSDTIVQAIAKSMQIELKLMQGKVDEALILDEHFIYEILPPMWFYYVPQLTKIKILLAKNTAESLDEAIALLIPLEEFLRKANRKRILVDLLALYALVLEAQGNEQAAFEKIIESLNLAAPGGAIRNYIDLGAPMNLLIKKLPAQNLNNQYIELILHAFEQEKTASVAVSETPASKSSPKAYVDIDELSIRELEVLKEVASGLRNKEIAEKLFVSEGTIKKHMYRMFQKWNIQNRIGLIKKGKELNILIED